MKEANDVFSRKKLYELDNSSLINILQSFPSQFPEGRNLALSVDLPEEYKGVKNVLFTAMGGSAIGGDLVKDYVENEFPVPVSVSKCYSVPKFASESTLAFVFSYSGNTEETLSSYEELKGRGAKIVVVASGGKLEELSSKDGFPFIKIPSGFPPRTSTGYTVSIALTIMERLSLIPPQEKELEEAYKAMLKRVKNLSPEVPYPKNEAKKIAVEIAGYTPLIYGYEPGFSSVAYRWKIFINENAKTFAFSNFYPELDHNEIVGWESPLDLTRRLAVIHLLDPDSPERISKRYKITGELIKEKAGKFIEAEAYRGSLLTRMFSLLVLGDHVGYYLALLRGVDPTPIKIIDVLKKKMAE